VESREIEAVVPEDDRLRDQLLDDLKQLQGGWPELRHPDAAELVLVVAGRQGEVPRWRTGGAETESKFFYHAH